MSVSSDNIQCSGNWLHPDVQSVFSIFCANMSAFDGFEVNPCLLIAVSGGVDSMALCLLANKWAEQRNGSIHAAIVDHGLRLESSDEAAYVSTLLSKYNISSTVLAWQGDKPSSAVQDAARQARYALLDGCAEKVGALHLLLGHHADDQRETVYMRMARATDGLGLGQAGMAAVTYRNQVRVLRPLLNISKSQLETVCNCLGLEWVVDPTNQSNKYERNRTRKELSRQNLKTRKDLDQGISKAQRLREGMQTKIAAAIVHYVRLSPLGVAWVDRVLFSDVVSEEIQQGCLSHIVQCVGGLIYPPAQDSVLRILKHRDKTNTLGGCVITPHKQGLLIMRELPRNGQPERKDDRFIGEVLPPLMQPKDVQKLQAWLKKRSRGENLPNLSIIRRFPVKMSPDDGCLVPCVGYSAVCSEASRGLSWQNDFGVRFSPPQSLTYCLKWLAPSNSDIIS